MARQSTSFRTSKTVAGAGLAGLGLFILYGNLAGEAARVTHVLSGNGSAALGLLPAVILSALRLLQDYACNHQRFLWATLRHLLLSSWPVLLVMLGAALSRDALAEEPRHR